MNTFIANPDAVSRKRLWFGFAGSVAAWLLAGLLNVIVAWAACNARENGNWFTQTTVWIVLGIVTFGLLAVAILAGMTSLRNWRALSAARDPLTDEARERQEYMAVVGVIVSGSMTIGLLWFCLPIYILGMCVRTR